MVEEWHDESGSFYRKYTDGFIVQGGIIFGNAAETVTFGCPFSSGSYGAGYVVTALAEYSRVGATPDTKAEVMVYSKTPTSAVIHGYAHGTNVGINWVAFGY